mgnify:CR=1 FL=1
MLLLSLPSRECGLKLIGVLSSHSFVVVTPFAGVWIEISAPPNSSTEPFSHSLRGSVD